MKGFQSKTGSHVQPSSKLGGSTLGKANTTGLSLSKATNAQGDHGNTTGLRAGASTFAHETNGSNTVAPSAGGKQSSGVISRAKAG